MTNNNQVNWDEIPEDVEAVVTFCRDVPSYYKTVNNKLMVQCYREDIFDNSGHGSVESAIEYFGDRWHSRPTPTTQPTPVTPESTQVESLEVEATTTPEFDWSSVEDDVEAVVLRGNQVLCYKTVDGNIFSKFIEATKYKLTIWKHFDSIKDMWGVSFIIRPPATTTPEENVTCKVEFYEGELPEGKIKLDDALKPSILTILQEAQQSILKHHGVTGKVKFTVTCSE